jgi:hypothetical protein
MRTFMPYPFAHPAAILPLARPMGRFAVPSALAIGSIIPDGWYLVPFLARDDSHSLAGLAAFCLPAGLLAYLAFHLLLKDPLVALLPRSIACRLAGALAQPLPRVPWRAVIASLLAGAATHIAWDALAHERWVVNGFQLLQHASTLAGTAVLVAWLRRWLRTAAASRLPPGCLLSSAARMAIVTLLVALSAGWALAAEPAGLPGSAEEARATLRAAGAAAAQAFVLSAIGYAMLWRLPG